MMDSLIAELEAAPEGTRELDYAIAKETSWRFSGETEFKEYGMLWRDATTDEWKQLPWWTTSLDAALALVPEGWEWVASTRAPKPHGGRAYLHNGEPQFKGGGMSPNSKYRGAEATALTPALALCIAALRVRQAMESTP